MPYPPYYPYAWGDAADSGLYASTQYSSPLAASVRTPSEWRTSRVTELTSIGRDRHVAGRRERALVWLVEPVLKSRDAAPILAGLAESGMPLASMTYGTLMDLCRVEGDLHDILSSIDFRVSLEGVSPDRYVVTDASRVIDGMHTAKDPELHVGLQDLGWMIGWELSRACEAFSDPDLWYPGVDEGIEPVPDDQVRLVIAASQRELDRERRRGRPPAPLSELPFRVQRAFAERRRLIYKTWGIGRAQWQSNKWSFWDIQDDPAWLPPWLG